MTVKGESNHCDSWRDPLLQTEVIILLPKDDSISRWFKNVRPIQQLMTSWGLGDDSDTGIRDRKPGHKLGLGLVLKGIMQLLPFA